MIIETTPDTLQVVFVLKEKKSNEKISLDGTGKNNIKTGIGFLDHMLEQLSKHGNIDLFIKANGDLNIKNFKSVTLGLLASLYSLWAIFGSGIESIFYGTLLLFAGIPFYFIFKKYE